jgi:hypothetical protein
MGDSAKDPICIIPARKAAALIAVILVAVIWSP